MEQKDGKTQNNCNVTNECIDSSKGVDMLIDGIKIVNIPEWDDVSIPDPSIILKHDIRMTPKVAAMNSDEYHAMQKGEFVPEFKDYQPQNKLS